MKKEYTKVTVEKYNENMEPTGEVEETTITSLVSETGKLIKQKDTGVTGKRVDLGTNDSEDNYEEVDDPNYTEVIAAIESEVSNGI